MKFKSTFLLQIIIASILFIGACSNANSFILKFCTRGNSDNIRTYTNGTPGHDVPTYQLWAPDVGNISTGPDFNLSDSGTVGQDSCNDPSKVTSFTVGDQYKDLLMTNLGMWLIQQNSPWDTSTLRISIPPLAAPFVKYCNKFLLDGKDSGYLYYMNFTVTPIPIECNFPISVGAHQIQSRSHK